MRTDYSTSDPTSPTDHPDAPLLRSQSRSQSQSQRQSHDGSSRGGYDPLRTASPTELSYSTPVLFTWLLTLGAGVSGLLFGYDTGVISSTLVGIGSDLTGNPLTTFEKSIITSCTSLFAFLTNPIAGFLSDRLGRCLVIILADIFFILGAAWQAFAPGVWHMVGGRCLVGVAIGSASFVVPLYISELAPAHFRGRLVMVSTLFITGGQVVAYLTGWLLSDTASGWRILVGLGGIPAVLQLLTMFWMPESPRWLVIAGYNSTARTVLSKVYGTTETNEIVEGVMQRIDADLSKEDQEVPSLYINVSGSSRGGRDGWSKFKAKLYELSRPGPSRRALVIACFLQGLQQLCGFNSFMYFSATIFSLVGFHSPTLNSLSIAVTNFVFTALAFYAIDNVGRRRILLYSIPLMVVALSMCAVAFNYIDILPDLRPNTDPSSAATVWPSVVLMSLVLYVASYAIGLGNVPWQQSELFPLSVRSLGSAFATSVNWSSNFIVGMTFLPMLQFLSGPVTFAIYALICTIGWFIVWFIYPETAGLTLEDVNGLLKDSWGVRKSVLKFQTRGGLV